MILKRPAIIIRRRELIIGAAAAGALLLKPQPAMAAISVTSLGTAGNISGSTAALTGLTAPSGALIFLAICEDATAGNPGGASVADSNSNSWGISTFGLDGNPGTSGGMIAGGYLLPASFTGYSSSAITYTKGNSGNKCAISAFYATGIATIRAGAGTARSFGSFRNTGTSAGYGPPTYPSGYDISQLGATYLTSGDLVVGIVSSLPGASSQGYVNSAGWSNLPAAATDGQATVGAAVAGGYQIYASGACQYVATINSADWGSTVWTFSPPTTGTYGFNMPMMGI